MLDTSFSRPQSSKSAILSQVVAVVISTGINYLLASNLGLFARFNTLPSRPLIGGVKVVELTPAEKTRVPAAAKADPLTLTPSPLNPSSTALPPFGQSNPMPSNQAPGVLPFPTVNSNQSRPKKPNAFSPKTKSKNPFSKGVPVATPKLSKPSKRSIPIKTGTASPTSLDTEPLQTPGIKLTPQPTSDNLDGFPTPPARFPKSIPQTPGPNTSDNNQTPSEDLKTALKNSDEIVKGLPPGQVLLGGKLDSQSYPPNKFRIARAASNNGYMVILVSVEPDLKSNQLITDIKRIAPSNNLKKLDESLKPQKLIDTIITDPPFAKLLDQAQSKARDGYKNLKTKPAVVYYRFPIPFLVTPSSP